MIAHIPGNRIYTLTREGGGGRRGEPCARGKPDPPRTHFFKQLTFYKPPFCAIILPAGRKAVYVSDFIILREVLSDDFHGEFEEMYIARESVVWLGVDYDGTLIVLYSDSDGSHTVRCSGQAIRDVV